MVGEAFVTVVAMLASWRSRRPDRKFPGSITPVTFIGDAQIERLDGDVDLFRIFVDFLISEAEDGVSVEKVRAVYLAIKSISIAVSAVTAVLSVGSRSGAQNGECSPGSTVPDCLAAANFAGSTPPT